MNLTLEIVSPNGGALGPACRKVFGPEGGRIGRAPDCEWVLPNPYISRHHATIRWISGTYYVESTGENGVAVGSSQTMLPKLERRALKHGDHLFIDEYEVVVGLDSVVGESAPALPVSTAAGAFVPADDPFDLGPTRASRVLIDPLEPAQEELDPLKNLGGGPSPIVTSPRRDASWNHTPGVSDHFAPPPAAAAPSVIPDDWDKTTFGRTKQTSPSMPRGGSPPPGAAASGSAIPDDWDKTNFSLKGASPAPRAPMPAPQPPLRQQPASPSDVLDEVKPRVPTPPSPGGARPVLSGAAPAAQRTAPPVSSGMARTPGVAPRPDDPGTRPMGRPAVTQSPSPAPAAPPPPSSAPPSSATPRPQWPLPSPAPAPASAPAARPGPAQAGGLDIAAFLAAAGVDPASIPPETAGALGQILRSVVQGVIDVLRARAEIKEQFRLSQTIVKTAENNPLKFAVNAEDALGSLLGRRNPAYLPPVDAFEDAFDDIRFHQLAMLAGMRAGFDNVLNRFDPEQLQEGFEKRARRGGLLSMSGKSRYWEQFGEEFKELAGDRERAFRRLFAEEFAAAYEKQLELLKRSHSKLRR